MNPQEIRQLVNKDIIFSYHAYEKMNRENITERDVKEPLLSGVSSTCDNSVRNNRDFAWNRSQHQTLTYNNLTIVFCNSKENACLVISLYHGYPHQIRSNPYFRSLYR